jgi:hypothetical protein
MRLTLLALVIAVFGGNMILIRCFSNKVNSHRYFSTTLAMAADPTPGYIVGGGRIGSFLFESNGKRDVLISSRSASILPMTQPGPIYVATRNNDLQAIIDKTPKDMRSDLVFLQNGVLTSFLNSNELNDNTQGLIYFAVSKVGEKPIDGVTSLNPEGLTAVTGKWANDFSLRLKNAGLTCRVMDKSSWTVAMVRTMLTSCI